MPPFANAAYSSRRQPTARLGYRGGGGEQQEGWYTRIRAISITAATRIISKEFRGPARKTRASNGGLAPTPSAYRVSGLFFLHVDIAGRARTGKLNSAATRVRRGILSFLFRPPLARLNEFYNAAKETHKMTEERAQRDEKCGTSRARIHLK